MFKSVMSEVLAAIVHRLSEEYSRIELKSDDAKKRYVPRLKASKADGVVFYKMLNSSLLVSRLYPKLARQSQALKS